MGGAISVGGVLFQWAEASGVFDICNCMYLCSAFGRCIFSEGDVGVFDEVECMRCGRV